MEKDLSYKEMYEKFYEIYYFCINTCLDPLEKDRKCCVNIMRCSSSVGKFFIVPFVTSVVSFFSGNVDFMRFGILLFVMLFIVVIILDSVAALKTTDLLCFLKNKFTPILLEAFGNIEYSPEAKIRKSRIKELEAHKLFSKTFKSYDNVYYGERKGILYDVIELDERSGRGVFIFLDLNKFVKNNIVIANSQKVMPFWLREIAYLFHNPVCYSVFLMVVVIFSNIFTEYVLNVTSDVMFLIVAVMFLGMTILFDICCKQVVFDGLKKVNLEDVEFNKRYILYSDDEVEARYLATPAFMERLKSLELAFSAKKIKISCRGSKMLLAIESRKDLFEFVNINKPLNSPEQFRKFFDQIASVLLMIDHFKLDEKTGL